MKVLLALPGIAAAYSTGSALLIAIVAAWLIVLAFFGQTGCFHHSAGKRSKANPINLHIGNK